MGLTQVAPDELAAVVTTLELTARPPHRPLPASPLRLVRWPVPEVARYRTLFRRVGAPWLWYSRLAIDDDALVRIIQDARVAVHAVIDPRGIEVGMLELDFRTRGSCDLAYFGLIPELAGQRHGRWLMAEAMTRAWMPGVERVGVNTCTLDHPGALGFYRAQGFVAVRRTIETFADPRALRLLPADAAPRTPYLAAASRR